MTNEDDRLVLRVDDALGRGGVALERQRRVLDDADAVAVLLQQAVDLLPAGAVDETPVDENDRARSSHDALL
jgi:hypothetical protein